jgi:hypothetical protein
MVVSLDDGDIALATLSALISIAVLTVLAEFFSVTMESPAVWAWLLSNRSLHKRPSRGIIDPWFIHRRV